MWSKISTTFKSRAGPDDTHPEQPPRLSTQATLTPDVMSSVREAHPNLYVEQFLLPPAYTDYPSSVFHPDQSSSASPPPSPTKAKRNLFRRMSKVPTPSTNSDEENDSPFKLSLSIPKRIKANLNLDRNGAFEPQRLSAV